MTISLVHYNPDTGVSASITATGGPSVGGYVNHSWRNLGTCATQGLYTNPWYAEFAKQKLSEGLSASQIIEKIKTEDRNHAQRQCIIVDADGEVACLDGEQNIDYIGHIAGKQVGVAGNMLATPEVLNAFYNRFVKATTDNADKVIENGEQPSFVEGYENTLPHSLIEALEAALKSGGDKRGTYSASLRIEYPDKAPIDIRVDWSEDQVIQDLRKVLSKVEGESFQSFLGGVPSNLQG